MHFLTVSIYNQWVPGFAINNEKCETGSPDLVFSTARYKTPAD